MQRRVGLVFVALLIAAMPTAAQDVKPIQLSIGGGWTGVYGPARDHIANNAGNFTLGVLFNVNPIISLEGEYAWNGVKKKQLNASLVPSNPCVGCAGTPTPFYADGNMQYGDFNVLVHAPTHGKAQPYGIVGGGVYYRPINITTPGVGYTTVCDPWWYVCYPALVSVDQVVGSRSSTDFGMNFGGGVNFKFHEHASFYVEVRYHYVWGPTISSANVPTQPIAGSDVTSTTLKANGKFLPITFGFRF